jgi:hypothetical protein
MWPTFIHCNHSDVSQLTYVDQLGAYLLCAPTGWTKSAYIACYSWPNSRAVCVLRSKMCDQQLWDTVVLVGGCSCILYCAWPPYFPNVQALLRYFFRQVALCVAVAVRRHLRTYPVTYCTSYPLSQNRINILCIFLLSNYWSVSMAGWS